MAEIASLEIVRGQLAFAREYVQSLLADIADDEWFAMPGGVPTHLAWQVGHLAMAEYGLCLFRQRGRAEVDADLMGSKFRKLFSRGSTVETNPGVYPPFAEIRATFDKVRAQVLVELPTFTPESLAVAVDMP
jgi:hypothetical protein